MDNHQKKSSGFFDSDQDWARACIEGILFISEKPVKVKEMAQEIGLGPKKVESILIDLQEEYKDAGRGFVIRKVAGGYRFYSNPAISEDIKAFVKSNIRSHLSRAALETLAIAAYKQPITRTQIAEIRGVRTDSVVVTLVDKGLLKEAGKTKDIGNPMAYKTTDRFLERLGLSSLDQLPPLESIEHD